MFDKLTADDELQIVLALHSTACINYSQCIKATDELVARTHYLEARRYHTTFNKLITMPGIPNPDFYNASVLRCQKNAAAWLTTFGSSDPIER